MARKTFDVRHEDALRKARLFIERGHAGTSMTFLRLWTEVLQEHHVTRTEVAGLVLELAKQGHLSLSPRSPRGVPDESKVTWSPSPDAVGQRRLLSVLRLDELLSRPRACISSRLPSRRNSQTRQAPAWSLGHGGLHSTRTLL